jgi:cyclopropane fatty-acyl-phospholipid synthase-like methyltransferase
MRQYNLHPAPSICELGGANSCFYDAVRRSYPDSPYTAVDNNLLGLRLLQQRASAEPRTRTLKYDVTSMPAGIVQADIVFSVGLIEHFTPTQTASVIGQHFSCARPGGLVVITFPTPTLLYRITRRLAEAASVWRFPDERPLLMDEVLAAVARQGAVLSSFINWPVVLTQGVVVARAW